MNHPPTYVAWFLENAGAVLFAGCALALWSSPFVTGDEGVRARGERVLAILIAAFGFVRPVYSDMSRSTDLPWAVASAFGFAFAISWLRYTHARSIAGWVCLALHALIIAGFVRGL